MPWTFTITNISNQSVTLACQTGDIFTLANGAFPTSVALASGESLVLVTGQGTGHWSILEGTGAYDVNGAPLILSQPLRLPVFTVATLPAGAQGMKAIVSDATSPTFLGALTGGGAVVCPVFYNGTAWVVG